MATWPAWEQSSGKYLMIPRGKPLFVQQQTKNRLNRFAYDTLGWTLLLTLAIKPSIIKLSGVNENRNLIPYTHYIGRWPCEWRMNPSAMAMSTFAMPSLNKRNDNRIHCFCSGLSDRMLLLLFFFLSAKMVHLIAVHEHPLNMNIVYRTPRRPVWWPDQKEVFILSRSARKCYRVICDDSAWKAEWEIVTKMVRGLRQQQQQYFFCSSLLCWR